MRIATFAAAGLVGVLAAGAASAETQTFALKDFSKVRVSAGLNAEIVVGGAYAVSAEGSTKALERLDIRVEGDVLVIGRKPRLGWGWSGADGRLIVRVSTPTLDALDGSSGSAPKATGVSAAAFSAQASSGANVTIAGSCGALNADASSGASLDAAALKCRTVNADASSGASIEAFASESVSADASSGASVDISGAPKTVNQESSSGGSVSVR